MIFYKRVGEIFIGENYGISSKGAGLN